MIGMSAIVHAGHIAGENKRKYVFQKNIKD
jgi:hypothetical protein